MKQFIRISLILFVVFISFLGSKLSKAQETIQPEPVYNAKDPNLRMRHKITEVYEPYIIGTDKWDYEMPEGEDTL